jgi:tetratricopeptide (TPR) repeat protein
MRKTYALCLLFTAAIASNAFAQSARVEGKIIDAATKAGIPNASVTVTATGGHKFQQEFKTDKEGAFRFLLIDGTLPFKFTYAAPGYASIEEPTKIKFGEVYKREVALVPGSAAAAASAPAAKADPAVAAYNEGAALANEGKNAEAIAKFEEAVAAKPDLTAGYQALAKLYDRTKQWDKAIDRANKALSIDSDDVEMNTVLFDAYSATHQTAKLAEVKKKLPANPVSLFNDAAKLINAGKDAEAEPLLKQAIAADEKFAQAYYELGMLYARMQKNADARTNLTKFLELAGPVVSAAEIETKCKTEGDVTTCVSRLKKTGEDVATAKEMLKYVK